MGSPHELWGLNSKRCLRDSKECLEIVNILRSSRGVIRHVSEAVGGHSGRWLRIVGGSWILGVA